MTSLADILVVVENIPDDRLREVSFCVVKGLSHQLHDRSTMWTLKELSKLAGVAADDPTLFESVLFLASGPRAKLLDIHFLYFDPLDEEAIGEPINDGEVSKAYQEGYLVDPQDGREVYEFESTLVPYFQISEVSI